MYNWICIFFLQRISINMMEDREFIYMYSSEMKDADYCIRHIFCGVFIFANFASRVLFANLTTRENIYLRSGPTHECDLCVQY